MELIDADALKSYIRSQRGRVFSGVTYEDMMMTFIDEVEPVTERTGHWIPYDTDNEAYDDYKCSACGNRITVDAERKCDIGFVIEDFDHCNKCGAHMIEEDK